jgi:tripartite-type tricarboxylate transporter receptor subunit TctC
MCKINMEILSAFCIVGASCGAWAQTPDPAQNYPSQTVRIIVPFSAGSVTDVRVGRLRRTIVSAKPLRQIDVPEVGSAAEGVSPWAQNYRNRPVPT